MATPTATPSEVSQDLTTGVSVTLECATAEAKIHYTEDGTEPTAQSTLYSTPITLQTAEASKTLKAIAVKEGMEDSEVLSITYTNSHVDTLSDEEAKEGKKTTSKKKEEK